MMKKIMLLLLSVLFLSGCMDNNISIEENLLCDPVNESECAEISGGNIKVVLQDQTTDAIELFLYQEIGDLTLVNTILKDQYDMVVAPGHSLVAGDWIILQQNDHAYQAKIDSVNVNVISMDTRFDYSYTPSAFIKEININMAVDGSVNAEIFHIKPELGKWNVSIDVTRVLCSISDNSAMDFGKFGGIPELNRGFTLRKANGDFNNFFTVRTNGDFSNVAFDVKYSDKAPAGLFGFSVRKTWAGQSKSGVAIRLDSTKNESLQGLVQDDLTGLTEFKCSLTITVTVIVLDLALRFLGITYQI